MQTNFIKKPKQRGKIKPVKNENMGEQGTGEQENRRTWEEENMRTGVQENMRVLQKKISNDWRVKIENEKETEKWLQKMSYVKWK